MTKNRIDEIDVELLSLVKRGLVSEGDVSKAEITRQIIPLLRERGQLRGDNTSLELAKEGEEMLLNAGFPLN